MRTMTTTTHPGSTTQAPLSWVELDHHIIRSCNTFVIATDNTTNKVFVQNPEDLNLAGWLYQNNDGEIIVSVAMNPSDGWNAINIVTPKIVKNFINSYNGVDEDKVSENFRNIINFEYHNLGQMEKNAYGLNGSFAVLCTEDETPQIQDATSNYYNVKLYINSRSIYYALYQLIRKDCINIDFEFTDSDISVIYDCYTGYAGEFSTHVPSCDGGWVENVDGNHRTTALVNRLIRGEFNLENFSRDGYRKVWFKLYEGSAIENSIWTDPPEFIRTVVAMDDRYNIFIYIIDQTAYDNQNARFSIKFMIKLNQTEHFLQNTINNRCAMKTTQSGTTRPATTRSVTSPYAPPPAPSELWESRQTGIPITTTTYPGPTATTYTDPTTPTHPATTQPVTSPYVSSPAPLELWESQQTGIPITTTTYPGPTTTTYTDSTTPTHPATTQPVTSPYVSFPAPSGLWESQQTGIPITTGTGMADICSGLHDKGACESDNNPQCAWLNNKCIQASRTAPSGPAAGIGISGFPSSWRNQEYKNVYSGNTLTELKTATECARACASRNEGQPGSCGGYALIPQTRAGLTTFENASGTCVLLTYQDRGGNNSSN